MARVVIAFAAVFSCGAVALGSVVVFLRSGVVRVNYMGVFIHKNAPYFGFPGGGGITFGCAHRWPLKWRSDLNTANGGTRAS